MTHAGTGSLGTVTSVGGGHAGNKGCAGAARGHKVALGSTGLWELRMWAGGCRAEWRARPTGAGPQGGASHVTGPGRTRSARQHGSSQESRAQGLMGVRARDLTGARCEESRF